MNIKIIATLMTFILGSLILLSRSWSKRERESHEIEAQYAQEILNVQGRSISEIEAIADGKLKELAIKLAKSKGHDSDRAQASLRADLELVLTKS